MVERIKIDFVSGRDVGRAATENQLWKAGRCVRGRISVSHNVGDSTVRSPSPQPSPSGRGRITRLPRKGRVRQGMRSCRCGRAAWRRASMRGIGANIPRMLTKRSHVLPLPGGEGGVRGKVLFDSPSRRLSFNSLFLLRHYRITDRSVVETILVIVNEDRLHCRFSFRFS